MTDLKPTTVAYSKFDSTVLAKDFYFYLLTEDQEFVSHLISNNDWEVTLDGVKFFHLNERDTGIIHHNALTFGMLQEGETENTTTEQPQ
jgi:hypothetical protein